MAFGTSSTVARVLAISLAWMTSEIMAAPPPPARTPHALNQPVEGYDMRGPYQSWRMWVENQKGPVTESLLETPEEVDGLEPQGVLFRFTKHGDFGHFLSGEVRGYCRPSETSRHRPGPGSCRYLLRRAYVPLDVEDYDESNPVSEWAIANFNASALARHLRDIGLGPDTNWWGADRDKMFVAMPSPKKVLAENAVIIRLDSIECPEMGKAIIALEGKAIRIPVDLSAVERDQQLVPPIPHSVITRFTVYLRAEGGGLSVEGSDGLVARLIEPVLQAADACEQQRQR
jgi:hypothetical protein